ncbi:flagellar basal-body rod modification protein FlgD [Halalkalibacter wakoensis JCM 9140]|uniref:Flagellar basal-body rod modification protein FlgD n=1 Tax=Halalkalibacter wakoensis JCM 9140 TaxID=1236970 RepID=W4PWY6_9BACI|nr:flagellar hook assembly protein FlgD [Halalkalibacter wakoensis]GAE24257.1 flagellar basal-body rod modification protein FlgD [Halalkalibacter wakoensis JCM 9140]
MTTIQENLMLNNQQKQVQQNNQGILGKDDFLKILITQLQNQDPANPMDDREFIAQMAQFSSLEQMTNMNQAVQKFVQLQSSQSLVQHSELIGKQIEWKREVQVDQYRTRTELVENVVKSVKLENNGTIRVQLDDGRWISNEQIVQISKAKEAE